MRASSKSSDSADEFVRRLKRYRSQVELNKYKRSFKLDSSGRGEDGAFIGVRMGKVFALAKEFVKMSLREIEKLLESPIHEARVGAVSIMDWQARNKKTGEEHRKELFELYISRHDRINSWDLVDRSCIYVVGGYLFDKSRGILHKLARSHNTWERRTAIVSTAFFIKHGDVDDAYEIAEKLLNDKKDLIHKATGWMLRYAGDKDRKRLFRFLEKHAARMPRVALRYSIEHLDKKQRDHYLSLKKKQE